MNILDIINVLLAYYNYYTKSRDGLDLQNSFFVIHLLNDFYLL